MTSTNFDLAPPAKTVDGLLAVPIDIQHIVARLSFDGATSTASGDATLDFVVGPGGGNPIFDLRQTITGAWLDGVAVAVATLGHHDFGGGANAQLRVLEASLAAGSVHTLRVTYSLGVPQASTAGAYQPAITWSAGPRLVFNVGFTDLGAGRYLEAWVPANLIFDQFDLELELEVMNTAVPHTLITNGTRVALGTNHWRVTFPARTTALSTLVEIRATDTLASASGSVILPVSGAVVTIEVWKLLTNPADLNLQIANLQTYLTENENAVGPYLHDSRFVAFINVGGMEYEGATTATPGSLRHETYHSWWGRAVKPASQDDGWWDEGWNVYHDLGGLGSSAFDFTDPPIELSPRNPWVRITPGAAYTAGERFFEGVASLVGVAALTSMMAEFYRANLARPVTTMDMERFLVARSGQPQLVDAYHRFVYGLPDPAPPPDLWLRDDPADPGANVWTGKFWNSPDLWIRNSDDDGLSHQAVVHGQDNWFYARVRNRGAATARHFVVTFNVKPYAGIEFTYPSDFLPAIAAAGGFDLLPGQSVVVKAKWPKEFVPPAGTHACWLAAALTRTDQSPAGLHVWAHNNLAQKNLTVVEGAPDSWFILPFVVRATALGALAVLELSRPKGHEGIVVSLLQRSGAAFSAVPPTAVRPIALSASGGVEPPSLVAPVSRRSRSPARGQLVAAMPGRAQLLDCGGPALVVEPSPGDALPAPTGAVGHAGMVLPFAQSVEAVFAAGASARIPIEIGAAQLSLALRMHIPADAPTGKTLAMDLVRRDPETGRITGGLAIEVRVRGRR
jgi:hypothetical protein